ncbi:hypothetical protein RFI_13188 [Reticulomyxa filosa]|uniref:Uncharacterized protein n=1 Tax=Reticulomyxa filosa TaxID=46433 RepID=X6NF58_RETFI|nr:hypothetical protein RFI_13188 [Reticulomyxa filosa]|eukprot:ETO23972.1 hypothetical protein RFI_13188 [Reticulomyxa filosa]
MNEKDKEEFVADVIKEYLHLSASSVKIKFPLVTSITNEMLIEQTRHLPFYQYHDFMVRIMEKEIKRMEEAKKKNKKKKNVNDESHRSKKLFWFVFFYFIIIWNLSLSLSPIFKTLNYFFYCNQGLFGGKEDDKEETDDDDDEQTEFQQAKQLENENNTTTKGHSSNKSNSYILSPAPVTIQRDNNTNQQPKSQSTNPGKNPQTEPPKQNLSTAPAKDDKGSDTRKASASITKSNEDNKNINQNDNLEQILDDMDLEGILDDDELPRDNSSGPPNKSAALRKRTQSSDRRDRDGKANTKHDANSDDQTKRSTRNVLSRALSRR